MPSNIPAFNVELAQRLMARPEGCTAAQLAKEAGCTSRAASNWLCKRRHQGKAFHPGGTTGSPFFATPELMEAWRATSTKRERTEIVMDALRAHGEAGAGAAVLAEQLGLKTYVIAGAAMRLFERGEVQVRTHSGWHIYWPIDVEITDQAYQAQCQRINELRADAAAKGGAVLSQRAKSRPASKNYGLGLVKAKAAKSAPVTIRNPEASKPQGDIVIPEGVRITRCPSPSYDSRYQVDPKSHPFGAGFAAVGIGRSVATGGAWA